MGKQDAKSEEAPLRLDELLMALDERQWQLILSYVRMAQEHEGSSLTLRFRNRRLVTMGFEVWQELTRRS